MLPDVSRMVWLLSVDPRCVTNTTVSASCGVKGIPGTTLEMTATFPSASCSVLYILCPRSIDTLSLFCKSNNIMVLISFLPFPRTVFCTRLKGQDGKVSREQLTHLVDDLMQVSKE